MNNLYWKTVTLLCGILIILQSFSVQVNAVENDLPSTGEIQRMLVERGADFYAYQNLEHAPDYLKPVIWEARMQTIFNSSWVADETNGWVLDKNGNVLEELPHFSELFPPDWEIPRDPNQKYME